MGTRNKTGKVKSEKIVSRFYRYIRPYKGRILLSVVASLGAAGADVSYAKLIQPLVDKVLAPGGQVWMKYVPVVVIGLALIKGFSKYIQAYFIRTAGQLVILDLRNDLYRHSLSLSMGYYARNTAGNLMSRILNDVGVLQLSAASILVDTLREGATLVGLTGLAFYDDWRLATVAFVAIPLAAWPASAIGRKIKGYSQRQLGALGTLTSVLEQAFSGIKVIKAFGTEAQEKRKFEQENHFFYRFVQKMIKYESGTGPVVEIFASLGGATVIWYGMHRVLSGAMTEGELFSIMAAIFMMYTPARRLTKINNNIQAALGAAERVFEVMDEPVDIRDLPGAQPLTQVRGEVSFENVDFAYDEEPVLKNFSLNASSGEVVALVGPSGAGKSTVAGLLTRFYDPTEGRICIDGKDIREATLESLKGHIAMVDQDIFLFNDSIANNIRYGVRNATNQDVQEAARQAFADDFICALPEGYETRIGDRGLRLSGGQRQRICIARAILRNAPILVLDEATSALDTESESMVQKALNNLMAHRTTLVIAHRLSTIMHADKIVVLEDGKIHETGGHEELLARDGLYRKLYDMQFQA